MSSADSTPSWLLSLVAASRRRIGGSLLKVPLWVIMDRGPNECRATVAWSSPTQNDRANLLAFCCRVPPEQPKLRELWTWQALVAHELAHLLVFAAYRGRGIPSIKQHGREWRACLRLCCRKLNIYCPPDVGKSWPPLPQSFAPLPSPRLEPKSPVNEALAPLARPVEQSPPFRPCSRHQGMVFMAQAARCWLSFAKAAA